MPPQPGETLLLTLYCDVHYYINAPGSKPQHDRFERGSYAYLYHNSIQRRARLEIANNAGTPEQDAFDGYLDTTSLRNTHRQPYLFTFTADAIPQKPASPVGSNSNQWRIPSYDLKLEAKYLYKVHALDLYLWTINDASKFLETSQRILPAQQLDLDLAPTKSAPPLTNAVPPSEHRDSMSPVVQHLEQAAITEPYRSQTTSSTQSVPDILAPVRSSESPGSTRAATLCAPVAYNPAAPQAPEPIAHREKTPPPPEADSGTGLMAAAVLEHPTQVQYASAPPISQQSSYVATPHTSYFPGPPQNSMSTSFPPPPPSGLGSPGFPPPPTGGSPHPSQQNFRHSVIAQQTYPQYAQQQAAYVQSQPVGQQTPLQSPGLQQFGQQMSGQFIGAQQMGQQTPLQTPGVHPQYSQQPLQSPGLHQSFSTPMQSPSLFGAHGMHSPSLPPPPPGGPSNTQTAPPGGFSNYTYSTQPQSQQSYGDPATVHTQLYRPTEAEAAHGHGHSHSATPQKPSRFDERFGKVEKGVNKWLKKLDQKI
ncbi:hypothetical protein MBLNU457_4432t1 [Dothideomycetes sp. NU457]